MKLELLNPYFVEQYLSLKRDDATTWGLRKTVRLWDPPITDRTLSDVNRVKELLEKGWKNFSDEERKEWSGVLKGALNISDIERIQNNIQLLSDVLELDLIVDSIPQIPNEAFYEQMIINVETIRNSYGIYADTPKTPNAPLNTYLKWNDIEKILLDVYKILMNNFYYYCGSEIYTGDVTGLLL